MSLSRTIVTGCIVSWFSLFSEQPCTLFCYWIVLDCEILNSLCWSSAPVFQIKKCFIIFRLMNQTTKNKVILSISIFHSQQCLCNYATLPLVIFNFISFALFSKIFILSYELFLPLVPPCHV